MIGQVTPIEMTKFGWKLYGFFVVSNQQIDLLILRFPIPYSLEFSLLAGVVSQICNFANAVFFWATLPETKHLPLEEMKKNTPKPTHRHQ